MRHVFLAKIMCSALFLMYGLIPFLLNHFEIYYIPYANINLLFSLSIAFIIFIFPSTVKTNFFIHIPHNVVLKNWITFTLFTISLIIFFLFPWHVDRESFGSSLAAFFRAAWLLVMFSATQRCEKFKLKIFLLSLVLMFIDESRTYFMIGFLAISSSSAHRFKLLIFGILMAVALAGVRMSISSDLLGLISYGIVGESYNAVRPIGQILSISDQGINIMGHLAHTFLQPLLFPFEFALNRIFNFDFPTQSSYFGDLVAFILDEKLSPMGGWYIVSDFVYYGYFGIFLLICYLYLSWILTCKLFNTLQFPFGAFIFFVSIKTTPYVYWKMIFYLLIVFYVVKLFDRLSIFSRNSKQNFCVLSQ